MVYYAIHHGLMCMVSASLQGVPTEILTHGSNTTCASVVVLNKSDSPSLHHLKFFCVCFGVCSEDGRQTVKAYSRVGLIKFMKAVPFACWNAGQMLRRRKVMVEFVFLEMLTACLPQERPLLIVPYRYFASDLVAYHPTI